ncbi:MAG: hypothetical protein A2508_01840 [Candidatus Lambdaproteobacteria bacterium RIFOXYD12_FULL_49_8]|uniref:Uncharacterized protein n=1 Tax=Candidatus Lambdaproteobacteria bacterium RIFOXYD2_FULL_50_16 TaxID=1817772 RepID=A0A1F6GF94_9PROT|nr:MAG: hypothetical protein A2527_00690 [Candidatus Lambdaproteobacteria bacterium RIFOXYD2_FULL_50_16]OGG98211.1 MAG: hypothetical protein A2508_01840 [Candidatus Lambdaproteobacteria bacterium RIFOXYD12_FULL_49_8]
MGFKFTPFLLFLTLWAAPLFALGDNSSSGDREIPLPEINYSVIVVDAQAVQTTAKRVSWDGKVYLQGKRGEALTTISFEKLNQVEVLPENAAPPGSIAAKVTLKSGETIDLTVKGNSKLFGETSFGKFEIYFRDLRKILFN